MKTHITYYFSAQLTDVNDNFSSVQNSIYPEKLAYSSKLPHVQGLERERHITLFFTVTEQDHVCLNQLEQALVSIVNRNSAEELGATIRLTDVYAFNNDEYSAIVCKSENSWLNKINSEIVQHMALYGIKPMRDDYKQHVTVGYVKPGTSGDIIESIREDVLKSEFKVTAFKTYRKDVNIQGTMKVIKTLNYLADGN